MRNGWQRRGKPVQYLRRVPLLPLTAPGLGAGERLMSPKLNIGAGTALYDFQRGA